MGTARRNFGLFAVSATLALGSAAHADTPNVNGPSTFKDQERREVIKAFVNIERIASINPDFLMAKAHHESAQTNFAYARANALAPVYQDANYQRMQNEVMLLQAELNELFAAYPRDESEIFAKSESMLELRSHMTRMEREQLETDDDFQNARAELRSAGARLSEQRRRIAIMIKSDPAFRAAVARMRD